MTAQPFGLNTPTVFLFLYLVMYPVYVRTQDPELAWKVGVAACFLSGVIEAAGRLRGRDAAAHHAARGPARDARRRGARVHRAPSHAGPLRPPGRGPGARSALILLGYFARVRLPLNLPAGLVAVAVGSGLAWATGMMQRRPIAPAAASFGLYLP